MDKISIETFIESDMGPEVQLLAHFSHTASDTIKAFADSHFSENLHSLQNCDNLWYFWYCPSLTHTLTCCLSQFYWTPLLCWILQSCYWIFSLFPTPSTSWIVFCVSNFDVKLSFSRSLSHCFFRSLTIRQKSPRSPLKPPAHRVLYKMLTCFTRFAQRISSKGQKCWQVCLKWTAHRRVILQLGEHFSSLLRR